MPSSCEYTTDNSSGSHTHLLDNGLNSRKVNVVLLDDTWIQRVEVHHQNELIPKTTLRLEDETSLVLVLLAFGLFAPFPVFLIQLSLGESLCLLSPLLVWTDVLQAMELVE